MVDILKGAVYKCVNNQPQHNHTNFYITDVSAIWTRLFDHKVFLHGEVQFTLREYEQKRNDIEVEHLFTLLEKVADIKGVQINRLEESVDLTLAHSKTNLNEALAICDSILNLECTYEQDPSIDLSRENNKVLWEQFVDSMSSRCTHIDNTFQQKEEELQKLYDDLQNKLDTRISS